MAERRTGNYLRKSNKTISITIEGQRLLHELAMLKGHNHSGVIETLIREEAHRLGISVKRIAVPEYQERNDKND